MLFGPFNQFSNIIDYLSYRQITVEVIYEIIIISIYID